MFIVGFYLYFIYTNAGNNRESNKKLQSNSFYEGQHIMAAPTWKKNKKNLIVIRPIWTDMAFAIYFVILEAMIIEIIPLIFY